MTDQPPVRVRPRWSWLSFLVGFAGALVVLGGIWIGIEVDAAAKAQRHAEYTACLESLGFYADVPNVDLDELIIAAEICSES